MRFNSHLNMEGRHAIFSPSQPSWLRYSDEQARENYDNKRAAERGTILHAWAKSTIDLGIKQARTNKTINMFVNDAIGYKMDTEVVLMYSDRFFGTADAICFRKGMLRIHDLKTGKTPAKMEQLEIYAALFCLEYKVKPGDIDIELRIYQNDEVLCHVPTVDDIAHIMDNIIHLDKILAKIDYEGD